MEWTQREKNPATTLEIKPSVAPLPMLLQSLRILAAPARELQGLLEELAEGNPFLEVLPPVFAAGSRNGAAGGGNLDDIADPGGRSLDLAHQLSLIPELSKVSFSRLEEMAERLGPAGRLLCGAAELAAAAGVDPADEESLLRSIQDGVDPPGLFARNLAECLLIQLRRFGEEDSDAWLLVREAAQMLEEGSLDIILRRFGWENERLQKALARLRRLDPSPDFHGSSASPVIPELKMELVEDGVNVAIIEENQPGLQVLKSAKNGGALRRMKTGALNIVSEYERRLETKVSVGAFLARRQRAFMARERDAPGPCVLATVAEALSLHPATVQRAASRTWCETPRGTMVLGGLFSRPLRSRPDISVAQIRLAIREAVLQNESAAALGRRLGVPARTVRWHRAEMGM
ncbi:MAG: hypothetical protein U9R40_03810 [Synergistota bacterium]|nr:hypothetical protein [Synergistota bacterium]